MGSACEALANPVKGFALYREILQGGGTTGSEMEVTDQKL